MQHYADRLARAIDEKGAPVVVGIDPVLDRLPEALQPSEPTLAAAVTATESFCRTVIESVAPLVPAVKINSAFFEALRTPGVAAYYRLVTHAHEHGLLVIGDIKRGDIGSTARLYARGHLATLDFADVDPQSVPDAVTLAGYLGKSAVQPFIDAARDTGRGMYVLVRPSDPEADRIHEFGDDEKFYRHMARLVHEWGGEADLIGAQGLSCVGAVIAPKDADSTTALRAALPHTPFLVPGYGAQGASADACRPCFGDHPASALVNASRSVIYAFSRPEYQALGDDWAACVRQAAQQFAADVRAVVA